MPINRTGHSRPLMALVTQNEFDVLFGTMYALWYVLVNEQSFGKKTNGV